jgi:hypothetical protein
MCGIFDGMRSSLSIIAKFKIFGSNLVSPYKSSSVIVASRNGDRAIVFEQFGFEKC